MDKIKSSEIIGKIAVLRKNDINNFITNYFLTTLNNEVLFFENNKAIIFLQKEFNFYRLYFATVNIKDLGMLFKCLPHEEAIYLENIVKTKLDKDFDEFLGRYFSLETVYQKMYKRLQLCTDKFLPQNKVNSDEIYKNFYSTFNIYYDHLMSKNELEELNKKNNILTIYDKNELKSFLIFRTKGKSAYLNHIANYGSKQNLIKLWAKFYDTLNYFEINYLDLWYDTKNKKALNMYRIEKFIHFPLYNYIYKAKIL